MLNNLQVIHQHPERQQSMKVIEDLEHQMSSLTSQHETLSEQLSHRRKQCHLLVFAIQQLMDSLDQEQSEESSVGRSTPMETD